jgi:hypothetical protein
MNLFKKLLFLLFIVSGFNAGINAQSLYEWSALGSQAYGYGVNGEVNAIVIFNGNVIAGGTFTTAGTAPASNIASYNGSNWTALGQGINGVVYALAVFNNELYAAGYFTQAGGQPANNIAKWNGTSWMPVGAGANDEVLALAVYNSFLVAGGKFNNIGSNIAQWNGSAWSQLGTGVDDDVMALTVYSGSLVAAGRFSYAGGSSAGMIAKWNGSTWTSLSSYTDDRIHALGVYNSMLVAGGRFTTIGGTSASFIAVYNGTTWSALGSGVDDRVFAIGSVNGYLVAGGQFKYAGGLYTDRIAKWDGSSWSRMITGMNEKVNSVFVKDSSLYAGGEFITAGGKYVNHIALWSYPLRRNISGTVRYADNNQLVPSGKVRSYRMDISSRELILVDTARINNGLYTMPKVTVDTLFVMSFPDDELADFVPTYYPSTIDWASAVRVYPESNLTNVDIYVYRVVPGPQNPANVIVSGTVHLNFLPPVLVPLPFKSDAIVYAKQGSNFYKYAVSSQTENYSLPSLAPGNYEIYANRIGYTSATRNITVTNINIDTLDFILDTTSLVTVKQNGSIVPQGYTLNQNYPNPFNPVTRIAFSIPLKSEVKMTVYDAIGREVIVLVSQEMNAGSYDVTFNAVNLSSGIYFYKLTASAISGQQGEFFTETRKMVLIK